MTAELAEGELLTRPKEYTVKFTFSEAPEIAPPVIDFTDVGFRYGPEHPVLFKDVNFGIDCDSRVAIVGPNGVGKSTLLNLVCGDIDATTGSITRNRFLRIGRYSQHFVDILPMDKNPVEYLRSDFGDLSYQEGTSLALPHPAASRGIVSQLGGPCTMTGPGARITSKSVFVLRCCSACVPV